jgi:16S rRNA (cytosine1402-N4)-methyltransferase
MIDLKIDHHMPVLLNEIEQVFIETRGIVVDCTVGFAGHSYRLLDSNPNIKLICNDKDKEALEFSKHKLRKFGDRVRFTNKNFGELSQFLKDEDIKPKGILADIGVSSYQLDNNQRGFGFDSDSLDMRMNRDDTLDAKFVVNSYDKLSLEKIFYEFGEIREYKKVAKIICDYRKMDKIKTARELSELLSKHIYAGKLHPATLVFQAIRIEVNKELEELHSLINWIGDGEFFGAIVVIVAFHSLEDRVIKNSFKDWQKSCICPDDIPRCACGNSHSYGKILTKKPIVPTDEEIKQNRRSRSSKMRIFRIRDE